MRAIVQRPAPARPTATDQAVQAAETAWYRDTLRLLEGVRATRLPPSLCAHLARDLEPPLAGWELALCAGGLTMGLGALVVLRPF